MAQLRPPRPKLVVVIVVDQFRPDYLQRFRSFFGKTGLNLFLERGANFTEARYEHAITVTCPGHAVVLTGSSPDVNGIVANSWFDTTSRRGVSCTADRSVSLLGSAGTGRSPRNLIDSTVGDVLKRTTAGRSRVITVAGKDRSAIMLGGHLADAAYWMKDAVFVTSTYYENELPRWVRRFNTSGTASSFLGKTWERLLPPEAYDTVGPDGVAAEEDVAGMGRTFPHRPVRDWLGTSLIDAFETSPFHNEVVMQFATQAIISEDLGRDINPDLLAIGLSANDLIGHAYGPDSHEVMDATIRTDRLLERFFEFLATRVGLDNVVLVLTADHGVAPLPEVLRQRDPSTSAARFNPSTVPAAAEAALEARYGKSGSGRWIVDHTFPFLYLDLHELARKGIALEEAEGVAKQAVGTVPGVYQALTATELIAERSQGNHSSAGFSFYPGRSGNIYYCLQPYRVRGRERVGTTHGSPWPYDAEVPLLWYGAGVAPGTYDTRAAITDLAPTLSALLGIDPPSRSQGRVLKEMMH